VWGTIQKRGPLFCFSYHRGAKTPDGVPRRGGSGAGLGGLRGARCSPRYCTAAPGPKPQPAPGRFRGPPRGLRGGGKNICFCWAPPPGARGPPRGLGGGPRRGGATWGAGGGGKTKNRVDEGGRSGFWILSNQTGVGGVGGGIRPQPKLSGLGIRGGGRFLPPQRAGGSPMEWDESCGGGGGTPPGALGGDFYGVTIKN